MNNADAPARQEAFVRNLFVSVYAFFSQCVIVAVDFNARIAPLHDNPQHLTTGLVRPGSHCGGQDEGDVDKAQQFDAFTDGIFYCGLDKKIYQADTVVFDQRGADYTSDVQNHQT